MQPVSPTHRLRKRKIASSIEMISEPIGVSRVTNKWLQKSVLIMVISLGHSSEPGVLMTQEALEEVDSLQVSSNGNIFDIIKVM